MDLLPLELKFMILKKLDISDLLNLRTVSKGWKNVISCFNLNEITYKNEGSTLNWFYVNEPPNYLIIVKRNHLPNYSLLKSSVLNLKNLKRLKIDFSFSNQEFKIELLNSFKLLEQLELNRVYTNDDEKLVYLRLPYLKLIYFNLLYTGHLVLDTPKLKFLYSLYKNLDTIELKQPETVCILTIPSYDSNLIKFENLRCVKLVHTSENLKLLENRLDNVYNRTYETILKHLSNLKEFHIEFKDTYLPSSEIGRFCQRLIKEKVHLGVDLDIYYLNNLVSSDKHVQKITLDFISKIFKHFCPFY